MFDRPLTPAERDARIAELSAKRDRLLAKAPATLNMQGFAALFCAAILVSALINIAIRPITSNALLALGFFGLMLGVCLWAAWRSYRPKLLPGDKWGMADRINYETDSPRDLQRQIDELRQS